MPNSNQKGLVPGAIAVVLALAVGIYFFTRSKPEVAAPPAAPSASVAPASVKPAPRPSSAAAVSAAPVPANMTSVTVETLGPPGFADLAQLAKTHGLFDAEGLRVEIIRTKIATDLAEDVSKHKADFGITFDFATAFTSFGKPGFVVLAEVAHADRPITVYARKNKNIATAADLKAKRVGVQPFPNSHYYLGLYLKRHGMSEGDITIVDRTHPQVPTALSGGEIDAVVDCIATLRGNAWNVMKTPGLELVDLSEPGGCPIRLQLIASSELVKKSPETAERFTRAIVKAAAYLSEQHDKAVDEIAEGAAIEGSLARKLMDTLSYEVSLGPALVSTMEAQGRWFQEAGYAKKGEPAAIHGELMYPGALRTVRPEAVTLPP